MGEGFLGNGIRRGMESLSPEGGSRDGGILREGRPDSPLQNRFCTRNDLLKGLAGQADQQINLDLFLAEAGGGEVSQGAVEFFQGGL